MEGLTELHNTYSDKGLAILAMPSASFNQQPTGEEDIARYYDTFPFDHSGLVAVNGSNEHPLW